MTLAAKPAQEAAPGPDCPQCPRLATFRARNRTLFPTFWNRPVPAFGALDARVLVVGLAPGLKGANRSGRPFTGDGAGDVLYPTLCAVGLANGSYAAEADDGLQLVDCRITNAVRCVPPENKPTGAEEKTCRPFLAAEIARMPNLRAIVALGLVSHRNVVSALGQRPSQFRFAHGAVHDGLGAFRLYDSYHCSRYNMNTGRLTEAMFRSVFDTVMADR